MTQNFLSKYADDFFLMLEGGFVAVNSMDEDSALKLFKAAETLRPESTFPKVGYGYMHLCKLEIKQSIAMFQQVLDKEPTNEMAKTFLGIAMGLSPTEGAKGEQILEKMTTSKDSGIKRLADTAIDFINRFVKKGKPPTAPQKPQKKKK